MADKKLSMADLLAQEESKIRSVVRNQEVEGEVVAINPQEIILDLGTKSEGVIQKKDLTPEQLENLKLGNKITATVIYPENEYGQVVLGVMRFVGRGENARFQRFEDLKKEGKSLKGRGVEVNKGGLVVEVDGIRGFLPTSQVSLSAASNLEDLINKTLDIVVIEVDSKQNKLIFSQKNILTEDIQKELSSLKVGDKVSGEVAAVLPFGVFVSLKDSLEGLVHISEISWERQEDPTAVFKGGEKVSAKVISIDQNTGRVNLSIRQLIDDPFVKSTKELKSDDMVKGTVSKITPQGVTVFLEGGVEGIIPESKIESDSNYKVGQTVSCLVDSVDIQRRKLTLAPFVTTTKGLIYK